MSTKVQPLKEDTEIKPIQESDQVETKEKSFSDVMPTGEFYPDLPKVLLEAVLDVPCRVLDAQIVTDYEGPFGVSDFALLLLEDIATGAQNTTLCGGMVVVKKLRKAQADNLLPLLGTIVKPGRYYDII